MSTRGVELLVAMRRPGPRWIDSVHGHDGPDRFALIQASHVVVLAFRFGEVMRWSDQLWQALHQRRLYRDYPVGLPDLTPQRYLLIRIYLVDAADGILRGQGLVTWPRSSPGRCAGSSTSTWRPPPTTKPPAPSSTSSTPGTPPRPTWCATESWRPARAGSSSSRGLSPRATPPCPGSRENAVDGSLRSRGDTVVIVNTDTLWDQALAWGTELAEETFAPGAPGSWDARATGGILAVTAYALAQDQHYEDVRALGVERLICPLFDGDRFTNLVTDTLADRLAPEDSEADPADPVVSMWTWLTRTWPVDELRRPLDTDVEYPPPYSIGGRCVPRPAVEVYLGWAGDAVDRVLREERAAVTERRVYVRVTGGQHAGQTGLLENPVWAMTPEFDRVEPGSPPAYTVTLGPAPDHHPPANTLRIERLLAEHIELVS